MMKKLIFTLSLLTLTQIAFSQKKSSYRNFFGKIHHQKVPLEGVQIGVSALDIDTLSDSEGKFMLALPKYYLWLYAQKWGYQSKFIHLNSLKIDSLHLQLEEEHSFDGFGYTKKIDENRNISSLSTQNLRNLPSNIPHNLQGRFSGFLANRNLNLRGINSILSSSHVLVILDGMPLSQEYLGSNYAYAQHILEDLEISQFENIHLLKDASAAALYGSRAANGVLVLETQSATKGIKAEAGTSISWQNATFFPKFLNSEQYAQIWEKSWQNAGNQGVIELPFGLNANTQTNWQQELFRTALFQKNYFFVKSRSEKTNIFLNFAQQSQQSFQKGQQEQRIHFVSQISHQLNPDFLVGGKIQTTWKNANLLPKESSWFTQNAIPVLPTQQAQYLGKNLANPLVFLENQSFEQTQKHWLINFFTQNQIKPALIWRNEWHSEIVNLGEQAYKSNIIYPSAWAMERKSESNNHFFNSFLVYENRFDRHLFKAKLGTNFQDFARKDLEVEGENFRNIAQRGVGFAQKQKVNSSYSSAYRYWATFFDIRYDYQNRYFLGLSYRAEASSRWGRDAGLQHYPALWGALLWQNSQHFLRLGSSLGWLGNSNFFDNFLHQGTFETGFSYNNQQANILRRLANPHLLPERSRLLDIYTDFSIFNQKLTGRLGYSERLTYQLLSQEFIPLSNGLESLWTNSGHIQSKSWELNLNFFQTLGEKILLSTHLNFMQNTWTDSKNAFAWDLAKWAGNNEIFSLSGQKIEANLENIRRNRQKMGKINPDFLGAFEQSIRYGNFELRAMFSFSAEQQIYDHLWESWENLSENTNALANLENNTTQLSPIPVYGVYNLAAQTDRYLRKTDHIRLKNLVLSYRLGDGLEKYKYFSGMEISLIAQNLWTNRSDFDPESLAFVPLPKLWGMSLRFSW